jgi:hypothetical protein
VERAQQAGQAAMVEVGAMSSLAARLVDLFRQTGGLAFDRLGLNESRKQEMVGLFSSYLSYLVAAGDVGRTADWAKATAVSSSTPTSGLNRIPDEERSRRVGHEMRFDVEHTELLRSPVVAQAVSKLLA